MLLNLLYTGSLILLSPWLAYQAFRHGKYRDGWRAKLWGDIGISLPSVKKTEIRIWIHAVSVGEVNLATGLCRRLRESADPESKLRILVSTTTVTGYRLAVERFGSQSVFYCPFDFTWAIRRTLSRLKPNLIILIELEIWPNWVRISSQQNVPVMVVNGRLSEHSFRGYRRLKLLVRSTFQRLRLVAAQNETYAERFRQLGTPEDRVVVTGSIKFDDAPLTRDTAQVAQYRGISAVTDDMIVWVAGSTQAGEEKIILQAYKILVQSYPQLRLISVPRHAERFDEVAEEITDAGFYPRRRSQLTSSAEIWNSDTVLLIDTIGELRGWWGLADVAFVGGSLGKRGGQNMLEPAGYGAAVCFGPNTKNFRDIVEQLIASNAADVVNGTESLVAFVARMLDKPSERAEMGAAAQRIIKHHQGAGAVTVDLIWKAIQARSARE